MDKLSVLSIAVSIGGYQEFLKNIIANALEHKSEYICVANVHMLVEAHNDPAFAEVLEKANVVTPDGMPLTWAMKLLYGFKQDRVAGMDLLPDLLLKAEDTQLPVFFYGGTKEMLDQTKQYLSVHFPKVDVAGMYSPPFRKLTEAENDEVVKMINGSGAGLVFVALGCPKQEKWMASMKGKIHAEMIGIGGALPVMVGMQKRAPLWMQKNGLEWLFRFSQEPKRLFKRYAVTNTQFIMLLIKQMMPSKKKPILARS
ncbi:WecB/TagA/CpsF family glycosyltransferase [Aridibaculum aurantiacum]|uniref:WecB/TagA/CpsF family glycosyltransferase n=1 Tax=Aridibaculum aurantiacum TaxID=2810307 RepID=UPI001A9729C0|nr:WecB/TagA/CpsF family glycosyltransferase [Aridibaculum aurantiacum]